MASSSVSVSSTKPVFKIAKISDYFKESKSKSKLKSEEKDGDSYLHLDFDVIDELTENRDRYSSIQGDPNLSLISFPEICRINLDRLRSRVDTGGRKPGLQPTISACLYNGHEYLSNHPAIKDLALAKVKMDLVGKDIDPEESLVINSFFRQILPCHFPSGKRQNCPIPLSIYSPVAALASDLCTTLHAFATYCIMWSLSKQDETIQDNAEEFESYVERFISIAETRSRGVKALMREYRV